MRAVPEHPRIPSGNESLRHAQAHPVRSMALVAQQRLLLRGTSPNSHAQVFVSSSVHGLTRDFVVQGPFPSVLREALYDRVDDLYFVL